MYFLWKRNEFGDLRISEMGLRTLIQAAFNQERRGKRVTCSSFVLDGEDGVIAIDARNQNAEDTVRKILETLGFAETRFIHAPDVAQDIAFAEKIAMSLRSPWFWAGLVSSVALLSFVGLRGIFWLSFWGSVGWFTAKGLKSTGIFK